METDSAFFRSELDLPVWEIHGCITKYTQEEKMHMPKSRVNDALAICNGPAGFNGAGEFAIERTNRVYTVKLVRRHNRQLHKATTGFVAAKLGEYSAPD